MSYSTFRSVKENTTPHEHFDTCLNWYHGRFISGMCSNSDCSSGDPILLIPVGAALSWFTCTSCCCVSVLDRDRLEGSFCIVGLWKSCGLLSATVPIFSTMLLNDLVFLVVELLSSGVSRLQVSDESALTLSNACEPFVTIDWSCGGCGLCVAPPRWVSGSGVLGDVEWAESEEDWYLLSLFLRSCLC